jgi:hypothetical protein
MDLAKIIADLRTELACLNSAIASMEQLARFQSTPDGGKALSIPESGQPETGAPVKRRRGRPRKADVVRNQTPANANNSQGKAEKAVLSADSAA